MNKTTFKTCTISTHHNVQSIELARIFQPDYMGDIDYNIKYSNNTGTFEISFKSSLTIRARFVIKKCWQQRDLVSIFSKRPKLFICALKKFNKKHASFLKKKPINNFSSNTVHCWNSCSPTTISRRLPHEESPNSVPVRCNEVNLKNWIQEARKCS